MRHIRMMNSAKQSVPGAAGLRQAAVLRRRQSGRHGPKLLRLIAIFALLTTLMVQPATTRAANSRPIIAETVVNVETNEDTPVLFQLPGYDPDGDPVTAHIISLPTKGTLYQVNPDGTRGDRVPSTASNFQVAHPQRLIWFEPFTLQPNECGATYAQFVYYLVDSSGLTSDELPMVNIDVTCVPDPPVATAAAHTGNTDSPITSVQLNYSDPDGGTLTVHFTRLPSRGTLYVNSRLTHPITSTSQAIQASSLGFVPDRCCVPLEDSFAWYVEDESGLRSAETINTIHIGQRNWLPSASAPPADLSTSPDTPVTIPFGVLDPDGDATQIIVEFTALPAYGSLVRVVPTNPDPRPIVQGELWQPAWQTDGEELRYIPDTGYTSDVSGPDSFAFCLSDENHGETCARIRLWVSAGAWVPSVSGVSPLALEAGSGAPATITVTGNGFASTSQVAVNRTPLETTYDSATQLSAIVPASLLTGPGAAEVTVLNSPGGLSSPSFVYVLPASVQVTAAMTGVGTDAQSPFNVWADAPAGRAGVRAVGEGALGIARLSADPTGAGSGLSGFFSLAVGPNSFSMLAVIDCTTDGNTLYAFDGSSWALAPDQSLAGGCLSADLTPRLAGASGSSSMIFAVGARDRTAPTTTASATTADGNPYAFGVATDQAVMVSLSAIDDATGSGVQTTYYTLDGGTPQTYGGPFTVSAVGTHTVTFWSVDQAGNVEPTASQVGDHANVVEIIIGSSTPPTITASATTADGQPYTAGTWTSQIVTVSFTCTDRSGLGLQALPVILHVSMPTSGVNQSVTHTCQDRLGNRASTTFGPINIAIGQTIAPAPVIESVTPGAIQAGSGHSAIQLHGTGFADDASVWWNDIQLIREPGTATDLTAYVEPELILTPTVAAITAVNPAPGGGTSNPVYVYVTPANVNVTGSAVGISTDAEDAATAAVGGVDVSARGSGTLAVALFDADPSAVAAFNGAGGYFDVYLAPGSSFTTLTIVDCNLNGGNVVYWYDGTSWAAASNQTYYADTGCVTITIDATTSPNVSQLTGTYFAAVLDITAPTTTASATSGTGRYSFGDWTNQNVQVSLSAADNAGGSGVKTLTYRANGAQAIDSTTVHAATAGPIEITVEGTTTLSYAATDRAGNVEATQSQTINIDRTAPAVTCDGTSDGPPTFLLNQGDALVSATVTDGGSGPAQGTVTSSVPTTMVGTFSVEMTGTDRAGNTTVVQCAYRVIHKINLLYSTTDSGPSAIVVQLVDANDVNYSSANIPVVALRITDGSGNVVQELNKSFSFVDKGPAGSTGGAYVYKLNTKGLTKGSSYTLLFSAQDDPVVHGAPFTG